MKYEVIKTLSLKKSDDGKAAIVEVLRVWEGADFSITTQFAVNFQVEGIVGVKIPCEDLSAAKRVASGLFRTLDDVIDEVAS